MPVPNERAPRLNRERLTESSLAAFRTRRSSNKRHLSLTPPTFPCPVLTRSRSTYNPLSLLFSFYSFFLSLFFDPPSQHRFVLDHFKRPRPIPPLWPVPPLSMTRLLFLFLLFLLFSWNNNHTYLLLFPYYLFTSHLTLLPSQPSGSPSTPRLLLRGSNLPISLREKSVAR